MYDLSSLNLELKIRDILSPEFLAKVSKETGFCKKESKFTPVMFFDLLLLVSTSEKTGSLRDNGVKVKENHGIDISKQGISKRFNKRAVNFIKTVFEEYLKRQIIEARLEAGWLSNFNHVRIKDGTRFDIPEDFEEHLAGSGGSASKAGVCIQYEYDIKSGKILEMHITEAIRSDQRDARETMDNIEKNDLVIRDLGYFILDVLMNIIKKEAYFISRITSATNIYVRKGNKLKQVNFAALYRLMLKNKLRTLEKEVFVGKKNLLPVRLIIELMPQEVYEKRMRVNNKGNKKNNNKTSQEFKDRARFNLFITNIEQKEMQAEPVAVLYRIRWQIELVFKIWKSTFGIDKTKAMKYERWLCLLYAKLLVVVINWEIIMFQRIKLYKEKEKLLSPAKSFMTLKDNFEKIRIVIKKREKVAEMMAFITDILSKNHWLEKKKGSMNFEKILYYSLYNNIKL